MLSAQVCDLRLREPFRIAHGSSSVRQALRVTWDGVVAEAPFVPYYHDDPEASLQAVLTLRSPHDLLPANAPRPARLAMELLRHALAAKASEQPLWKHLGLPNPNGKAGCRSLGIPTDLNHFRERVEELSRQFRVLKLKLGSGNVEFDEAVVAAARESAPRATLLADVNGGWTPTDAAKLIPRVARHELAFIEQPVSHLLGIEAWRELRSLLAVQSLPLVADESAQSADDVPALADVADGVNVKLLKCGALIEALRMIRAARELRIIVMLGCMIESSIGVTFAAHLAGAVDWIDLDGHFYLANDEGGGLRYDANGALHVP